MNAVNENTEGGVDVAIDSIGDTLHGLGRH